MTDTELIALIAQETSLQPQNLDRDATIASLDISSLDLVSLLFELEDRYGVEISLDDVSPDMTLGQLMQRIQDTPPA